MVGKEDGGSYCTISTAEEWGDNGDMVTDIRFGFEKMRKMSAPKRPKRIECKKELYDILEKDILDSVNISLRNHNELIFPFGNPFNILFPQTDFSEWSSEDLKKGYKIIYE